jgi:hypothetical protein
MKTYIVYVNGVEAGTVKAASHNAAETKAKKKFGSETPKMTDGLFGTPPQDISVVYTEV